MFNEYMKVSPNSEQPQAHIQQPRVVWSSATPNLRSCTRGFVAQGRCGGPQQQRLLRLLCYLAGCKASGYAGAFFLHNPVSDSKDARCLRGSSSGGGGGGGGAGRRRTRVAQ